MKTQALEDSLGLFLVLYSARMDIQESFEIADQAQLSLLNEAKSAAESLSQLINGRLSKNLVSPNLMGEIIANAKVNLPAHSSFPCEFNIMSCYEVIDAKGISEEGGVHVVFTIPSSTLDSQLDLYYAQKYPIMDHETGYLVESTLEYEYFALSKSKAYFTYLTGI